MLALVLALAALSLEHFNSSKLINIYRVASRSINRMRELVCASAST